MLECAIVRAPVIFLILSGLFLGASTASAEVIRLKNGRTIYADQVHENGSHLEYEIGEDSYAIPKSAVDRVEAGGVRPERSSAAGKASEDIPSITPSGNLKNEPEIGDKLFRDGKVDADALAAIEQQGNAPVTAAAYFLAGKHEMEQTNFSKAKTYFETALRFEGQNPTILNYYVALLLRTGNAVEALPYAERAVRIAPDSPDTLAILGYAQYASDRNKDAIRSWKRSLQLRPDAQVQNIWRRQSGTRPRNQNLPRTKAATLPLSMKAGRHRNHCVAIWSRRWSRTMATWYAISESPRVAPSPSSSIPTRPFLT